MTKKLISIIFAFILSISSVSILSVNASAANNNSGTYNAEAALKYAEDNWDSGVGLCAEFASRCIQAGGVNVFEPRVINLYNALNGKYGTSHKLVLTGGTRGSLRMSDNADKIEKGDLIFYYCNCCKSYTHVIVCNGANSDGYIQDYAHNSAHNGRKRTYTYGHSCGGNSWTMYGMELYDGLARYGEKTDVGVPEVTSVKNGADGIVVEWTSVKDADKYNVYRKRDGGNWTFLAQTKSTSYTDKTSINGIKYFYTVRAIDNKVLSQYFKGKSVISLEAPKLKLSNAMNCVTIKWTPVIEAEGYYIYRMNSQKKWVKIADIKGGKVTSYTDKNVESGKTYKYTAKAYFPNATGAYSSRGSSITYVETPYAFVSKQTSGGLKIIYSDIEGANKYKIYRKVKGDAKWSSLGYSATNSYVDKTVTEGKTYVYTVRAIAGNSYSSYRNNAIVCKYVKANSNTNQSQLNRRG